MRLALASLALFLAAACGPERASKPAADAHGEAQGSPNARPEMAQSFLEDLRAERHPSDGAGRAWLVDPEPAVVSTAGTWTVEVEVGPLGIKTGGALYLQVSPFWGWDTPQPVSEHGPGYTTVTTEAEGVVLRPETLGPQLLVVHVEGRALEAGERVRLVYGAGSMGARADLYAERASRFWIAVDGDGDGVRAVLPDSPSIEVRPGPAERLVLTSTSTAEPGGDARLTIALLDRNANAGVEFSGVVELLDLSDDSDLPAAIPFETADGAARTLSFRAGDEGVYRFRARVELESGIVHAESNPLHVSRDATPVYWADLHGHSGISDGTGTPEDYLAYAREVSALDVIALTDHDHYGMLHLDVHADRWDRIREAVRQANDEGRFLTLLGFEWTSWIYGHRHVVYFEDEGRVHSSLSEESDTPAELWERLRGQAALTLTHHSAGDPIAADWRIAPDPVLEPLAEIVSVHGSSEAADSPSRLRGFLPEHSVRSALDRGYRLGFVGSGDSHDGHPGFPHLSPYSGHRPASARRPEHLGTGGLAAVRADELSRASVLEALRGRRTYATSGPRILLAVALEDGTLSAHVIGTSAIEKLDVIRSGSVVSSTPGDKRRELRIEEPLVDLAPGEYVYVRVVQTDRGLAWSSPIFVE